MYPERAAWFLKLPHPYHGSRKCERGPPDIKTPPQHLKKKKGLADKASKNSAILSEKQPAESRPVLSTRRESQAGLGRRRRNWNFAKSSKPGLVCQHNQVQRSFMWSGTEPPSSIFLFNNIKKREDSHVVFADSHPAPSTDSIFLFSQCFPPGLSSTTVGSTRGYFCWFVP